MFCYSINLKRNKNKFSFVLRAIRLWNSPGKNPDSELKNKFFVSFNPKRGNETKEFACDEDSMN